MKSKISVQKMPKSMAISGGSAEAVASVDDLLLAILLLLPIRSLLRFKSVSKRWLSLITDPRFALIHISNRNLNPALGLFFQCFHDDLEFEYIHFDVRNRANPPFRKLEFAKDPSGINILKSCSGLFLCSSFRCQEINRFYYVYNATTKQFLTLPKPGAYTIVYGVNLAFNPAKSPHYKVILVRGSNLGPTYYQIEIYSSESGSWRISGHPFSASHVIFQNGVYWNGAVHWIFSILGTNTSPLYFNIDQESVEPFPLPAIPDNLQETRLSIAFFGESCDHLHLIPKHQNQSQFNVYELKRDYSEWFTKYHVDLSALRTVFPRIFRKQDRILYNSQLHERDWMRSNNLDPIDLCDYVFSVFAVIRGEKEEDDFLVLQIPGKAIRYNLVSNTFQKLCDFEGFEEDDFLRFNATRASPYIESLYCV